MLRLYVHRVVYNQSNKIPSNGVTKTSRPSRARTLKDKKNEKGTTGRLRRIDPSRRRGGRCGGMDEQQGRVSLRAALHQPEQPRRLQQANLQFYPRQRLPL